MESYQGYVKMGLESQMCNMSNNSIAILLPAEASSTETGGPGKSTRKQLLRMKMYNRVIAVPAEEDYDSEIYSEALDMFVGAAGGVAESSR